MSREEEDIMNVDVIKMNYIFVKKNLKDFIQKNKLKILIKDGEKQNGNISAILLCNEDGIEFHRIVFSSNTWKFENNLWIEEYLNITLLPMFAGNKKDVLRMKFKMGERLDMIKELISRGERT